MARAGRRDRGLLAKKDSAGKPVWYVRLYHEGKERRFGSFSTKTAARDFYEGDTAAPAGFLPKAVVGMDSSSLAKEKHNFRQVLGRRCR
jgi:hypothetical protein